MDDRKNQGREGFGDDQGTRIGKPTPGAPREDAHAANRPRVGEDHTSERTTTGAGAEAAEGIHAADGDRAPDDRTSLDGKSTGRGEGTHADRSGSEPESSHDHEHHSRYGGDGGGTKNY